MKKEDVVVNEIKKDLNWRERIVVSIFKNTFLKIYKKGKIDYYKYLYKK